ncbi:A24 family peptidase [soil metagenome]
MSWHFATSVACAFYGLLVGQLVPIIIARVPEPDPQTDPDPEPVLESDVPAATAEVEQSGDHKELYVDIARRRGLAATCSVTCAVVAGALGGAVGWSPALSFLLYLVPVGVGLAVIDWRTRLLPTKLIAPSYLVVIALVLLSAWAESDREALFNAGWGWLVAGGSFFALWFIYPRGMGYGDVRLSGILGIALGYLGWTELLVGIYAGFVVGGVGGLILSLLRVVDRKAYPFGPFMLIGAVLGVVLVPALAAWYP